MKEYKYYNSDWEVIKIKAHNKSESRKIFQEEHPEKDINQYECIEPEIKRKNYSTQTFSEFEATEFKNRKVS